MPTPSLTFGDNVIEFITIKAQLQRLGLTVDDVTRPGVDGQAFRENAKRSEPIEVMATRDCESFDDAKTTYEQALVMQGALITVVDDFGQTFSNVMCLKVDKAGQKPASAAAGGLSTAKLALLTLRIKLQATE